MQQETNVGLPNIVLSVQSGRLGLVSCEAVSVDDLRTFFDHAWLR